MEQPSEAGNSTGPAMSDKPQTSATAFASSGFAKLAASSSSPFGALGGAGKPSLFGSSAGSSFGSVLGGPKPAAPPAPSAPPKLSFGSAGTSSPFSGMNGLGGQTSGSVFKSSAFGGAFGGGALSGSRLANFGGAGEALKSRPAKPFGAPDSDEEKSDEEDHDEEDPRADAASDDGESKDEEADKDDPKAAGDDKKKQKLHKSGFTSRLASTAHANPLTTVVVDDGEGREITIFSVRSKMYLMEKGVGWKERGAGMLKVNVPRSTVDIDGNGVPDPSSFDPSALGDDDAGRKHVRLIMRQDHTLRVILNTVIQPAMTFQVTHKLKSATILFTAFEGGEAKQVQMKVRFRHCYIGSGWGSRLTGSTAERGKCHGVFTARGDAEEAARGCLGRVVSSRFAQPAV